MKVLLQIGVEPGRRSTGTLNSSLNLLELAWSKSSLRLSWHLHPNIWLRQGSTSIGYPMEKPMEKPFDVHVGGHLNLIRS